MVQDTPIWLTRQQSSRKNNFHVTYLVLFAKLHECIFLGIADPEVAELVSEFSGVHTVLKALEWLYKGAIADLDVRQIGFDTLAILHWQ